MIIYQISDIVSIELKQWIQAIFAFHGIGYVLSNSPLGFIFDIPFDARNFCSATGFLSLLNQSNVSLANRKFTLQTR